MAKSSKRQAEEYEELAEAVLVEPTKLAIENDLGGVQKGLRENAELYARWGLRNARLKADLSSAERELKDLEGQLYVKIEDEAAEVGRKLGVEAIKSRVKDRKERVSVVERVDELTLLSNATDVLRSAYSQRAMNLQALSRMMIDEIQLGIAPREQISSESSRKDVAEKKVSAAIKRKR